MSPPKILFRDDYSQTCHPRIAQAIANIALESCGTYGLDDYSAQAAELIKSQVGPHCDVHFVSAGTLANILNVCHVLRPHESVIACDTGHINVHESGAIEATGHKINVIPNRHGKMPFDDLKKIVATHTNEHLVRPRLVYLSQSTELGSVYTKAELTQIADYCRANDLYLHIDGARLGAAMASAGTDLTLADYGRLVDIFWIGGTKNGGLFGEAIVISNETLKPYFRNMLKQRGGLMAKGMALGIQFVEFFKDGLYMELAQHAHAMAMRLATICKDAGADFRAPPQSNMLFPILPEKTVAALEERFNFYRRSTEADGRIGIRLITSWATTPAEIDAFATALDRC